MQKITTKSGTVYLFKDGYWKRNDESWYPLHSNYCVTSEANTWDMVPVQVGLLMYTSALGHWWLSTPIVNIEEVDDEGTD
jgi:hypothetical protein